MVNKESFLTFLFYLCDGWVSMLEKWKDVNTIIEVVAFIELGLFL